MEPARTQKLEIAELNPKRASSSRDFLCRIWYLCRNLTYFVCPAIFASNRMLSMWRAGVSPTSCVKTRAKLRGLMAARRASLSLPPEISRSPSIASMGIL